MSQFPVLNTETTGSKSAYKLIMDWFCNGW